jgi:hypothetical protein
MMFPERNGYLFTQVSEKGFLKQIILRHGNLACGFWNNEGFEGYKMFVTSRHKSRIEPSFRV